jgi:signal transduction histidine kinase
VVARESHAGRGDVVRVMVRDNGKGIAQRGESEATRFGLMGMRERVQALDGVFQIDNRPGEGVTVTAMIPARISVMTTDGVETA